MEVLNATERPRSEEVNKSKAGEYSNMYNRARKSTERGRGIRRESDSILKNIL